MLFHSINFLIFFPVAVLLFWIVPKRFRYLWLLAASYYFYMSWNAKYALLIGLSTVTTWLCGLGIERVGSQRKADEGHRRLVIALGFVVNIGILFFFKYYTFAFMNVNRILSLFHISLPGRPFDIMLPVGISFYTFQALGYIVDVYRGDVQAERNLFRYALFVSFFPQLVAGPIERSGNLLEQIRRIPNRKAADWNQVINGLLVMLYGFFMKMVIADRIAIFVDEVFDHAFIYGTVELALAAMGFAIQIYCDFGSYSLIATGAAQVMGFTLMENFNTPYFACSIKEFWRRWHISLSSWFRDYLYIPLGGSRCSKPRKYFNLMLTFLVSGLWHGARWNYVVWGGMHGMYQIVGELLLPVKKKVCAACNVKTGCSSFRWGQMFTTFVLTSFAWIFFRASSLKMALLYVKRMVTKWNPWVLSGGRLYELGLGRTEMDILKVSVLVLFLVDLVRARTGKRIDVYLREQNLLFQWIVALALFLMILVCGEYGIGAGANQFIYFQF